MREVYKILLIAFLLWGCKEKMSSKKEVEKKVEFDQNLANELAKLAEVDQIAAYIP